MAPISAAPGKCLNAFLATLPPSARCRPGCFSASVSKYSLRYGAPAATPIPIGINNGWRVSAAAPPRAPRPLTAARPYWPLMACSTALVPCRPTSSPPSAPRARLPAVAIPCGLIVLFKKSPTFSTPRRAACTGAPRKDSINPGLAFNSLYAFSTACRRDARRCAIRLTSAWLCAFLAASS